MSIGYGSYGSTEIELVGGPLDGKIHEISKQEYPMANSRFWLSLESGEKAWYQYSGWNDEHRPTAYYVGTTK